jgi:hypothetical protein
MTQALVTSSKLTSSYYAAAYPLFSFYQNCFIIIVCFVIFCNNDQVMGGFLPASDSHDIFPASDHVHAAVKDRKKIQAIIDSLKSKVLHY